jgi:hypothetical protein
LAAEAVFRTLSQTANMISDIDRLALRVEDVLAQVLQRYPNGPVHQKFKLMQSQFSKKHYLFREYAYKGKTDAARAQAIQIVGMARELERILTPQKPLTIDLKLDWM